jgi:hypothetical protein
MPLLILARQFYKGLVRYFFMDKKTKVMVTFVVVIVLIASLYFFTDWFSKVTGYFGGEDERELLAVCLAEKGAEFYGTEYCADCEKQVKLFGEPFSFISYVDCGREKEFCPNIREIPAWYIDQKIIYGFKTLDELKEISGCVGN